MLIIKLVNDGTGNAEIGNYDVTVTINMAVVWKGRVEGHDRRMGWPWLIRQLSYILTNEEA